MPTLGNIQKQVAMYLKKSLVDFDVTGDAGQNLVLTALNNARKYAEKVHDFSVCRQRGYFSFTNKTAWDSPTWYDGGVGKLRKGKLWDLRTEGAISSEFGGTNIPLKMIRGDTKHQLESRRAYDAAVSDFERRALPDSTLLFDHPLLNQVYIMTRGKWLEYYPYSTDTKNIMVDGYRWWPDWPIGSISTAITTGTTLWEARLQIIDVLTTGGFSCSIVGSDLIIQRLVSVGSIGVSVYTVNTPAPPSNVWSGSGSAVPPALASVTIPNAVLTQTGHRMMEVFCLVEGDPVNVVTWYFEYTAGSTIVYTPNTYLSQNVIDWWTENASEYLLWRAIVECNHLGHVFTANREANLPSPDKKADMALALLIQNDQDAENPGEIQQY
jgi:hypothetical protein